MLSVSNVGATYCATYFIHWYYIVHKILHKRISYELPPNIMIINYKLLDSIQYGSTIKYENQLKTSRSPVLFLQDVLYGEKDLLEGRYPICLA